MSHAKENLNIPDLTPVIGKNLRRLRGQRRLSLERLSNLSGVSRAMLSQIELSQSTPTINVLWKIVRALDVTFSALISDAETNHVQVLRKAEGRRLASATGQFVSRALFPFDTPRSVEFYELTLAPRGLENAEAHPPGTTEHLVVHEGVLEMKVGSEVHRLEAGDSILFEADVGHSYSNPGKTETRIYLVMIYASIL